MIVAGYRERDFIARAVAGGGEEFAVLGGCAEMLCKGTSDCLDPRLASDV